MFLMIFNTAAFLTFITSKSQMTETVSQIKKDYDKTNEYLKKYEHTYWDVNITSHNLDILLDDVYTESFKYDLNIFRKQRNGNY